MAIDLNADVGQIIKSFFNKKGGFTAPKVKMKSASSLPSIKPYTTVLLLGVSMALAIVAYGTSYAVPEYKKNAKLGKRLNELHQKEAAIPKLQGDLGNYKRQLNTANTEYQVLLGAFDDTADLEDLYNAISTLALSHNLTVVNIQKGESSKHKVLSAVDQTSVNVQISGGFYDYLHFKEQLANNRPLLSIQQESMASPASTGGGNLQFALKLTTYTIDKSQYRAFITEPEYGPQPAKKEMAYAQ